MSVKKKRKNTCLTDEVKTQIQIRYSFGEAIPEIADSLQIKRDTLQKAVRQGRVSLVAPVNSESPAMPLNKSARSIMDNNTAMGKACSHTVDRVLASVKGTAVSPEFTEQTDLSCAGVLLSLPALLSNGLLAHSGDFKLENVYYPEDSIFLCLAFLSLLRIKNTNQSDKIPCGESGRALGLDRIPEVKTLRGRIASFVALGNVEEWGKKLSQSWMAVNEGLEGVLYIDGRVKIYYGHQTKMPKRYVSRLRLCMSGSTDYYVNDKTGQPFFVVNEAINNGMIAQIKDSILPRLEKEVPDQPTQEALEKNDKLHRFMIVCDRECYSIELFHYLWEKRVAICTYRKNVKDIWPEEDFTEYEIVDQETGATEKMKLAEKEITLEDKDDKNHKKVTCREIRKLTSSHHQTAIITTNFMLTIIEVGLYMFARWCQENFFKYMKENFDLDGLVSYYKEKISDTKTLVNPKYRQLDSEVRSLNGKLSTLKAKFGNLTLKEASLDGKKLEKIIAQKAQVHQDLQILEKKVAEAKEKRKNTDRKIAFKELPEDEQFTDAINDRKHFMDNVKMIAYRAETSMYRLIKGQLNPYHTDEGRALLKQIYSSDADIVPDYENQTLTVKIHNLNNRRSDKVLQYLCEKLNETETQFPGTNLRLIYNLVSS